MNDEVGVAHENALLVETEDPSQEGRAEKPPLATTSRNDE